MSDLDNVAYELYIEHENEVMKKKYFFKNISYRI